MGQMVTRSLERDEDFIKKFRQLQEAAHITALEKGWRNSPKTFGEDIALFHSEISEALEEYRNGHQPHEIYRVLPPKDIPPSLVDQLKPEGIPIELADLFIRIFDVAEHYDIDLISAIFMKMKYNETRSFRHGGKVL